MAKPLGSTLGYETFLGRSAEESTDVHCWLCNSDVPPDFATVREIAGVSRNVCHGCAKAKCNGCDQELAVGALHEESGCCEDCHIEDSPLTALEALHG